MLSHWSHDLRAQSNFHPRLRRQRVSTKRSPPSLSAYPRYSWRGCGSSAPPRSTWCCPRGDWDTAVADLLRWLDSGRPPMARPPEPCPRHANAALAGAALRIHSLGWRDPQFSTGYTSCHDQHAPERAAAWLIRRFAVRPSLGRGGCCARWLGWAAMSALDFGRRQRRCSHGPAVPTRPLAARRPQARCRVGRQKSDPLGPAARFLQREHAHRPLG